MKNLHIALLPMVAHGHMIPILDMAKLFSSRGITTTVIVTPAFADPVIKARDSGHKIGLTITPFPPHGSSLPPNIVSFDQMTTPDLVTKFLEAMELLQEPVEKILYELRPDCLISDMFLPWTTYSAAKFNIPRLIFHGTSCFARCASEQLSLTKPYKSVSSESEPFVIPNLPDELTFVRTQVPEHEFHEDAGEENDFIKLKNRMRESEKRSYGEVINSFYELESAYTDHLRNVLERNVWHIGPLLLCNNEKSGRGKESAIDEHECLAWLDSKKPNSVLYVCFGSMASFSPAQLHELAVGLDTSGQNFVWVLRKGKSGEEENEDWLPQGFEERIKGKGLIIRGWAPQVMILNHVSIGAFVTHCGWNSTLEGICAGVPMVTWPVFAEQFYNEKLVTVVMKTGVSVGSKKWQRIGSEGVGSEAVAKAVEQVMVGEGAAEMRSRAKYYKEMARKAVEEGGSSYNGLNTLIEDLSNYNNHLKE